MEKRKISPDELKEILRLHEEWLESDGKEGVCADLSNTNLSNADLRNAKINDADFCGADFRNADLSDAKLSGVDMSGAVLDNAKLSKVDVTDVRFSMEQFLQMRLFFPGQKPFLGIGEESPRIIRSIEFPPEYHQAGISILNYFGAILRDKYPDKKAKIKIEQDGLKVTMIVESEEGDIETIEKLLDDYGLVIHGKMLPEKLLDNREEVLLLKIELRHADERVETYKKISNYLKADVQELRLLLSQSLKKPGVQITTGDITGETIAIGQDATATTIIDKYESNKDKIDSILDLIQVWYYNLFYE